MRHGYKLDDSVLRHALVGVIDTIADIVASDTGETGAEAEQADTGDNTDTAGE